MKNTIIFIFSILLLIACQPATSTPTATLHESLRGGPDRDPLAIKESAAAARTTDLAEASAAAPTPFTPPPPTATEPVFTATTPPGAELFTGSIELANGLCCAGGEPGHHIKIPAMITGLSKGALVTEMRLAYSYASGTPDIASAEWQFYKKQVSFPIEVITNWVGFEACVQLRDEAGNISEVYCDDISVEGMPAKPSPLLQLEYDLYWKTKSIGDLMHFDHETQQASCLIGQSDECEFVIEGGVWQYDLNEDRTKLLIDIIPADRENHFRKLAILDLHSSAFNIFHEIDELAGVSVMSLSPDGLWVAYQQVQYGDTEDGHHSETLTIRIVSTYSTASPAYEFECGSCQYTYLLWSQDSNYLSFGGRNELRTVSKTGDDWKASTYFTEDQYSAHSPHSWAPDANHLLTMQSAANETGNVFLYNYLFDPSQNSYVELYQTRTGVHISSSNWVDGKTLAAIEPIGREKYTLQSTLFLTELTSGSIPLEANTQEYTLSFEDQGFAFLPHKLSDTELAFGRITQKPDESFWIETYSFDTTTQALTPIMSCLFSTEEEPFLWDWGWAPGNDLLFSEFTDSTLIIPTDGRACINLNLLLGVNFDDLDWAP